METYSESRPVRRPTGNAPSLEVLLSVDEGEAPLTLEARAQIVEGSVPVYFGPKLDADGRRENRKVLWELFGPNNWDYRNYHTLTDPKMLSIELKLEAPGPYRLRSSVVDRAGRVAVVWKSITVR